MLYDIHERKPANIIQSHWKSIEDRQNQDLITLTRNKSGKKGEKMEKIEKEISKMWEFCYACSYSRAQKEEKKEWVYLRL